MPAPLAWKCQGTAPRPRTAPPACAASRAGPSLCLFALRGDTDVSSPYQTHYRPITGPPTELSRRKIDTPLPGKGTGSPKQFAGPRDSPRRRPTPGPDIWECPAICSPINAIGTHRGANPMERSSPAEEWIPRAGGPRLGGRWSTLRRRHLFNALGAAMVHIGEMGVPAIGRAESVRAPLPVACRHRAEIVASAVGNRFATDNALLPRRSVHSSPPERLGSRCRMPTGSDRRPGP
jgi:hypothetical protein